MYIGLYHIILYVTRHCNIGYYNMYSNNKIVICKSTLATHKYIACTLYNVYLLL